MRLLDLRLVLTRDDVLRVSVEGRRVALTLATNDPSIALAELARRIDDAAWSSARSGLEEMGDASSVLYQPPSPLGGARPVLSASGPVEREGHT